MSAALDQPGTIMTDYHRVPTVYRKQRTYPAYCLHCQWRTARPNRQWPHLATGWCSDRCRINWQRAQQRVQMVALAETIRSMLGLPGDRGYSFTLPELEAMERRLRRVLPYGGLAMMPARMRRKKAV